VTDTAGVAIQQVSLMRLETGGDINTNINLVYHDRATEEREGSTRGELNGIVEIGSCRTAA
jgi:hypothetical protein